MSVESSYFIVDWATLQRLPKDTDLSEHFILGPDDEEEDDEEEDDEEEDDEEEDDEEEDDEEEDDERSEWQAEGARGVDFGGHQYYFESWNFATEVSDWLRPLRGKL